MAKELAKQYDPKNVEDRIYKTWLDGKYFHAEVDEKKNPYTIVIPPPNITGQLHMGHALDNTLQDILIRFRRMQGFDTLWLPGTDHASIATEAKIVEAMKAEGISKWISAEKASSRELGTGKLSTAAELLNSSKRWARPATGTESVLLSMKVVQRQLKKYS